MTLTQKLVQLKAFARQDGAMLSAVWLVAMWFVFRHPESIWGAMLTLSTPFFVAWRLKSFRDDALDGHISFRRALAYSCYVFFYASLLFALGQYLYFRFLDNGEFLAQVSQSVATLKPIYVEHGIKESEIAVALKLIEEMKPSGWVFTFMTNNLLIGAAVSPLIALMGKRK